jgi:hypothetical protein
MDKSHAIARLAGPVFAVIGIGMLVNGAIYRQMAAQFIGGHPLIYFSGVLLLIAGLTILNMHSQWTPDWRSVITALGWIFTCVGTFRILAPQFVTFVAGAILANNGFLSGFGIVLLALGGFITFKGYAA